MKTVDILKGTWLGHPLHPALVHIPVGLWPAALLFDLLSRVGMGSVGVHLSFCCIALGLFFALLAVPAGIADWSGIKKDKPAWKLGLWHMGLNLLAAAIFAADLGLRFNNYKYANSVDSLPLLLTACGVFVVLFSGYLGGRMVYEYGTSVARMSKKEWRHRAEAAHSNVPPEKEDK